SSSQSSCGNDGTCDGAATPACRRWSATTVCSSQVCTNSGLSDRGAQANTDFCSGSGTCVDNGITNCLQGYNCITTSGTCSSGKCSNVPTASCASNFDCNIPACQTNCTDDSGCVPSYYCDTATKTCKADKANGGTCTTGSQCTSSFCADDVCCDGL